MPSHPALPRDRFLYAIIDAGWAGDRSLTTWAELLCGEDRAQVIQWRFKELSDAKGLEGAFELRAVTRRLGVPFFINDRPDIAKIVGADGVHVGQDDLDPDDVRAILPGILIGVSTHNREQVVRGLASSADYIAVGPVFGTTSKENADPTVGVDLVAWAAGQTERAVVAVGGLNTANVSAVVKAGARGIAAISELMRAEAPGEAARDLQRLIRQAAG